MLWKEKQKQVLQQNDVLHATFLEVWAETVYKEKCIIRLTGSIKAYTPSLLMPPLKVENILKRAL